MNHSHKVTKLLLAFDAAGRWSSARYAKKRERTVTGSTSIRVSKVTLDRLRDLARDVGRVQGEGWMHRTPSLGELLDWISAGVVIAPDRELANACQIAIDETHAKRLEKKPIERRWSVG